jgi:hypothetical protein
MNFSGGNLSVGSTIEVIEELSSLNNVEVSLKLPDAVSAARLEPQGVNLPLEREGDVCCIVVPELNCHQMIVFK